METSRSTAGAVADPTEVTVQAAGGPAGGPAVFSVLKHGKPATFRVTRFYIGCDVIACVCVTCLAELARR